MNIKYLEKYKTCSLNKLFDIANIFFYENV